MKHTFKTVGTNFHCDSLLAISKIELKNQSGNPKKGLIIRSKKMSHLNKSIIDSFDNNGTKYAHTEANESDAKVYQSKAPSSKTPHKIYKVTITFIQISEKDAKIKRSIVENIMKKNYK